jgi:hypothetical protein
LFGISINAIDAVMSSNSLNKFIFLPMLMLWLTACVDAGPYIFKDDEFNRASPEFAMELKDRSVVEICYNKWSTTPKIVTQIAKDECRRFGKVAYFVLNQNLTCSVGSPAKAVYWCLCPNESYRDRFKKNKGLFKGSKNHECPKR